MKILSEGASMIAIKLGISVASFRSASGGARTFCGLGSTSIVSIQKSSVIHRWCTLPKHSCLAADMDDFFNLMIQMIKVPSYG
eukprot:UN08254